LNITITGSRGFIGSNIVGFLQKPYREIDHTLGTDCRELFGQTGTLIHLAASISEGESYMNPRKYINNNIGSLAKILSDNKFDNVIFASSSAVYDINGRLEPRSIYGVTKLAGEHIIKNYAPNYWILRITNPFGPNDKKSVFAKLAECKKLNRIFTIYNNTSIEKDFFHVWHIGVVIESILDGTQPCGTHNVGSGVATNVYSLLTKLCDENEIRYTYIDQPDGLSSGYIPKDGLLSNKEDIEKEWKNYLS